MKSIKRLKPLIKLELKPVLWISIYLMLVNIFSFIIIKQSMNERWIDYLLGGIGNLYNRTDRADLISELFTSATDVSILLYLLGIMILSFVSLKHDKGLETGRFLKGLPYTSGERSLVKVSLGSLGYTISFLVYSIGLVIMQRAYCEKVKEIYEVIPIGQIQDQLFNTSKLLVILFVLYLVGLAFYLFCMLVQYIVSHKIGSTIITLCALIAPFFLIYSIKYCFNRSFFSQVGNWLYDLTIGARVSMRVIVVSFEVRSAFNSYVGYMTGYRIIFYIVVIIALILAIWKLSKRQFLEEVDKLIPITGLRWLFVVGVTLCGSFLVCDLYLGFIEPLLAGSISAYKWLALVIGAIISFIVAKKIAFIGFNKRKEVKA